MSKQVLSKLANQKPGQPPAKLAGQQPPGNPPSEEGSNESSPEPPEPGSATGKDLIKKAQEDHHDLLADVFGDRPKDKTEPVQDPTKPKEPGDEPPPPPVSDPPKKEGDDKNSKKPEEGKEDDDSEVDLSKSPDVKKKEEPKQPDPNERETEAQRRAKENGQALKALQDEHDAMKAEYEALKLKHETEQNKPVSVDPASYYSHPEVTALRDDAMRKRDEVVELQEHAPMGKLIQENYGLWMTDYIAGKAADAADQEGILSKLYNNVGAAYKARFKEMHGEGYDEMGMESEMNQGAREFVQEVKKLLINTSGTSMAIREKVAKLVEKARAGTLTENFEGYKVNREKLEMALTAALELPEDFKEQNPFDPATEVANLVASDPAWKKQYNAAVKQMREFALGPQALSEEDISNMEKSGTNVREFLKARNAKHLKQREALIVLAVQGLMLRARWSDVAAKAARAEAIDTEAEILGGASPRKPDAKPAKKEPATLGAFKTAALDIVFGEK